MIRKVPLLAALLLLSLTARAASAQPTNVIFFIGDGMGPAQVEAAGLYAGGPMSFEGFAHQAYMTTYSANNPITDSAAAATAMATGVKVPNGVISMSGPTELYTLLEYYRDLGRSTGLVTTTYMTHATPAAFGAHEPSRDNLSQIASDYLNQTRPNVLLGGGANGMSVFAATTAGYNVVTDRASMLALDTEMQTYVSGQFGSTHLPYEYDGVGLLPHLSEMTSTALNILDNDTDGFFLMVEGGRIDQAGHDHDIARNVTETVEFANSVQQAINWASGRSDTLIIVAADHETGGLVVNGPGTPFPDVTWTASGHTATNVPVYAWGVNAYMVTGLMDNTDLWDVMTIPEPATIVLIGFGAITLARMRRPSRPARTRATLGEMSGMHRRQ